MVHPVSEEPKRNINLKQAFHCDFTLMTNFFCNNVLFHAIMGILVLHEGGQISLFYITDEETK